VIPYKLQLRNFMCYGEDLPPLQFDGVRIACLSGENGAGKSALLDALTWALWGQARGRSDDDLVMLGREEMEVVLEFEINHQLHRVIRRRKRAKRGTTTLDFQVCKEDGSWSRITGDTVVETQRAINRVLRMEYDTFINSAFLLQGRADEFASRKPAERKQVLADILGLSEYEALERRAKEVVNSRAKDLDVVQSYIQRLESEVAERPEIEQRLAQAQDQVVVLEEDLYNQETELHDLRERAAQLRDLNAERRNLMQQIERQAAEVRELEHTIEERQKRIDDFEMIIARRVEIEDGCTRLQQQREALQEMDRRAEEREQLREKHDYWRDKLNEVRYQLETEHRLAVDAVARFDGQIARRAEVEHERQQFSAQSEQFTNLQRQLAQLREEERALLEQQSSLREMELRAKELENQIALARNSLQTAHQTCIQRINELTAQAYNLPEIAQELTTLSTEIERLDSLALDLTSQREELASAMQQQGELKAERKEVEKAGKEIKEKLDLVESGEGECPVCHSTLGDHGLATIRQHYVDERNALLQRHQSIKQSMVKIEVSLQDGHATIERWERELEARPQLEARRAQLQLQQMQAIEAQDKLVVARQELTSIEQQLVEQLYAADEQARLATLQKEMLALGDTAGIGQRLADVRAAIDTLSQQLEEAIQVQGKLAQLDAELAQIAQAETQRPVAWERCQALATQLAEEQYGEAERRELDRIVTEGKALGYNKETHVMLRAEVAELAHWEREAFRLEQASASIEDERKQMRRNQSLLERYNADLTVWRDQVADLEQQVQDQPMVERALRDAETHIQMVRFKLGQAQNALGSAEADLRRCDESARRLMEQQKRAAALLEERAVYEELAQAFGKKGIQAMLIETAIPEIEREANSLLSRMTDNQLQVAFETQRDTKKGDSTIETLDIRISDVFGTRDYGMYSGGEAFRINFALRIALSKLLARRAGASLKTLIVDEGFGTQDAKGRDRIVEAINAIEDEFERILIITHIQELKDMFQAQIEITKTLNGSTWSMV
jgi:exonuclease SbcC